MKTYNWYSSLSRRQCLLLFGTILIMAVLIITGVATDKSSSRIHDRKFTVENSIKEIAPALNVTGKALAGELGIPSPKKGAGKKPLSSLGVSPEKLDEVVEHLLSHKGKTLKYYLFAALFIGGLVFMVKLGRPESSEPGKGKNRYPAGPYILFLFVSLAAAGFYLGKSPNPMEGVVKVFKSMAGLYPDPWMKFTAFLFFIAMAVIGNKLICGWACPFGALQELIYSLPLLRKSKSRIKISFIITNTIRTGLFILMILILFGIPGGRKGFVLYHNMNPFNLFDFKFESLWVALTVIISVLVSFIVYRPFCRIICPFGLFSWFAERISIFRIRIDKEKCTECGKCIKACPLGAAEGIVSGRKFPEDCFSCARCLDKCPVDAIKFS